MSMDHHEIVDEILSHVNKQDDDYKDWCVRISDNAAGKGGEISRVTVDAEDAEEARMAANFLIAMNFRNNGASGTNPTKVIVYQKD